MFSLVLVQLQHQDMLYYGFFFSELANSQLCISGQLSAVGSLTLVLQSYETGEMSWIFWKAREDKYPNLFLNKVWVFN